MNDRLEWYARRLGKMSPAEMVFRAQDAARQKAWERRQVAPGAPLGRLPAVISRPRFTAALPAGTADKIDTRARHDLRLGADAILDGKLEILGVGRSDLADPDWFFDPVTGRRAPAEEYAFAIDHRSEAVTGNVKQVWELSRLHHLTLLAAAWYAVGDDEYAKAAARQLQSWWEANPFLSGVNWTSGIEVGIRLISFAWIRRLLDGFAGAPSLFEENPLALHQIAWHQQYLVAFRSRGSSANNHVIAEAAGQLIGSLAFPWFGESERWRTDAARLLESELRANTFPSGLDREQAASYHGFVLELALLAAVEADVASSPLSESTWRRLAAMADAGVAVCDASGRPPRYGDGDDGRALVVDGPPVSQLAGALSAAAGVCGTASWWPELLPSVEGTVVAAFHSSADAPSRVVGAPARPARRPSHFADAGVTILRSPPRTAASEEVWCRCDGGPHGFLSIAAHGHADALSVEVRHGGVDLLADPGTYCYHGEPAWRRYFRSTLGHNTIEVGTEDQSVSGGAFLWLAAARTSAGEITFDTDGRPTSWSASHDGYDRLDPPVSHRRTVRLGAAGALTIDDRLETAGRHAVRMAFHLGPEVSADLGGDGAARLTWTTRGGETRTATLELPQALAWTTHRGETDPILGWYSPAFGVKEPTVTLIGEGATPGRPLELTTMLTVTPLDDPTETP